MTPEQRFFKKLDKSNKSRVRISNRENLEFEGKGDISMMTPSSLEE